MIYRPLPTGWIEVVKAVTEDKGLRGEEGAEGGGIWVRVVNKEEAEEDLEGEEKAEEREKGVGIDEGCEEVEGGRDKESDLHGMRGGGVGVFQAGTAVKIYRGRVGGK